MHEYETSMVWSEGRTGKVEAPGLPPLDFASPPEFGGPGGTWTPEHAFVTAATSCILLTFVAIAEFSKLQFRSLSASATGKLEKVEGEGLRFTSVEVTLRIEVGSEADIARAERLAQKAEASCLVSKSLKTPVKVKAEIRVAG
ncbi:MAG TPA: OsmC family protein [Vicinamibacteria bacterium]|nr:OsmC family protein [Vicinamibacteria bacterium]